MQGRGNLTSARRWDVNNEYSIAQSTVSAMGYNTTGSTIFTRDPLGHQTTISYTDSFSPNGVDVTTVSLATLAYPTTVTDADSQATTSKYHYDLGAITRVQDPKDAAVVTQYDAAARVKQVTNAVNQAYTRFVYPTSHLIANKFSTIDELNQEAYSATVVDGAGRVRAVASDLPNSTGYYSGQHTSYDILGRAVQSTNPTEMSNNWMAVGDDAVGWYSSSQTFDWQGRPIIRTNTDGTTKRTSYDGCGCAGGEVVTFTDENGRRQKKYHDVLDRLVKTEILNWDGGIYSTTKNTYDVRDKINNIKHYQGADTSSTFQETIMTYDGHGRLETTKLPIQTNATSYVYNDDDTVRTMTDARQVITTYSYNSRHLAQGVSYTVPSGVTPTITQTTSVAFDYDQVGNRLWMTDGLGSVDYQYDTLSQLESETRQFNGVGTFTLAYESTLSGAVKKVTDPFGVVTDYSYDQAGRLEAITGSGGGVPTYATNMRYRAWGVLKGLTYGNGLNLSLNYNERLQVSRYEIKNSTGARYSGQEYQYTSNAPNDLHNDGRVKYSRDLNQSRLDRFYRYDHVGRLAEGLSGNEARQMRDNGGTSGNIDGPYRQWYSYDVWGNLSSRVWRQWIMNPNGTYSPDLEDYYAGYTNNRRTYPGWQYDSNGNLTASTSNSGSFQFIYDAAGHLVSGSEPNRNTMQAYDGDGHKAKRVENGITTYYLSSRALGKVITEVDQSGQKKTGHIYAGGVQPFAKELNNQVTWVHRDPNGLSQIGSKPNGTGEIGVELDPLGVEIDPAWAQYSAGGASYYNKATDYWGNMRDPNMGCYAGSFSAECGSDDLAQNSHHGIPLRYLHGTPNGSGYGLDGRWEWVADDSLDTGSVDLENNVVTVRDGGGGQFVWRPAQNSGAITDGELNSAGNLIDKNYDRCRKLLGAKDPEAPGREGAGLALAAAQNGVDDATMIGAIWQHESGINTIDYYGDAGPAQLTISGVRNNPRLAPLVVGNAYGTWHGRLDPKTDYSFDGSVQDNVATLRNLVRYGRAEYGSNYMTAYHYGPGYPKAPRSAKAKQNRNKYAQNIMRIYNKYLPFFECLTGP